MISTRASRPRSRASRQSRSSHLRPVRRRVRPPPAPPGPGPARRAAPRPWPRPAPGACRGAGCVYYVAQGARARHAASLSLLPVAQRHPLQGAATGANRPNMYHDRNEMRARAQQRGGTRASRRVAVLLPHAPPAAPFMGPRTLRQRRGDGPLRLRLRRGTAVLAVQDLDAGTFTPHATRSEIATGECG